MIRNDNNPTVMDWVSHANQSFSSNEAKHFSNIMLGSLRSQEQSLNAKKNNLTEKRDELVEERGTICKAIKVAQSKIEACKRENKKLKAGNQYSSQQSSFNESEYKKSASRVGFGCR